MKLLLGEMLQVSFLLPSQRMLLRQGGTLGPDLSPTLEPRWAQPWHTWSLYMDLYLSSTVRVFKTVVWSRLHLLCVLDRTKEASSHAQMLLLKPAFQSLQNPCRIKCVNFFIFVQFLTDFC